MATGPKIFLTRTSHHSGMGHQPSRGTCGRHPDGGGGNALQCICSFCGLSDMQLVLLSLVGAAQLGGQTLCVGSATPKRVRCRATAHGGGGGRAPAAVSGSACKKCALGPIDGMDDFRGSSSAAADARLETCPPPQRHCHQRAHAWRPMSLDHGPSAWAARTVNPSAAATARKRQVCAAV